MELSSGVNFERGIRFRKDSEEGWDELLEEGGQLNLEMKSSRGLSIVEGSSMVRCGVGIELKSARDSDDSSLIMLSEPPDGARTRMSIFTPFHSEASQHMNHCTGMRGQAYPPTTKSPG